MVPHEAVIDRELSALRRTVHGVAGDSHTRYRSTYLLDELFHDLVVRAAPRLFVEAGAYEADASVRVAAALPGCRVVAFEANPYNAAHFTGARDYAALGVDYRHEALADRPGEVSFHLVASSSERGVSRTEGFNSLLRRTGGGYLGDVEYEEVTVPATTLDEAFPGEGPSAIWIDVEGAVNVVLAGADDFLDRCAVMKVEVEQEASWQGQWLAREVVAALAPHDLVPVARDAQGADQYNLIFVRGSLAAGRAYQDRIAAYEADVVRTLSRPQGRLRRSPALRRIARGLLRRGR